MSLNQLRNCNFGKNMANAVGSTGVGYALLDTAGAIVSPRTTAGVYQLVPNSGLYAADISFPDDFNGQVLWDTGTFFAKTAYATEHYNVEENDPKVAGIMQVVTSITGSIQSLMDINYGRWKIDKTTNRMLFYAADNVTLVATFDLFDDNGAPTFDGVFERRKV